ncbi:hypothetical protein GCM10011579_098170 [Streptomyces albiflavescens]|uniref:Uncharacterized protein n=1 Tax=Streptomyces albiflavescens TaxID=1623582 RepID=A0A917YH03_9ACTN|nr:hypothetical protein GCM10011579_098170 [Streptomyces albiflavescens]
MSVGYTPSRPRAVPARAATSSSYSIEVTFCSPSRVLSTAVEYPVPVPISSTCIPDSTWRSSSMRRTREGRVLELVGWRMI